MYDAMDWLELGRHLLGREMSDLSGGERQRLALALPVTGKGAGTAWPREPRDSKPSRTTSAGG